MSSFPYEDYNNRKKVASLIHKYIHREDILVKLLLDGITEIDKVLYSEETLSILRNNLVLSGLEGTNQLITHLSDSVSARENVYRFFLKGSNALEIIMYHIEKKHKNITSKFPGIFYSDWDTTIIINPELPPEQFNVLFNTFVSILQKELIQLSQKISVKPDFHTRIEAGLITAKEFMNVDPEFEKFRKYPITYKKENEKYIMIHDQTRDKPEVIEYVKSLGISGKGLTVSSNLNGGISPENVTGEPKFYLGRIILPIIASKNIWLPVEILDISMNYQNEDLHFAWESHSEYNIQFESTDFRVISPTSLYFDLKKCLLNADKTSNKTKKNKIPARINRIQKILNTMIIPYKNTNMIIKENLEKYSSSDTLVGDIRRNMDLSRKNK
jgi:hypothetical protein